MAHACISAKDKGLKGFLKNNVFVIIAFFVPALFMGISFTLCEFAPFGGNMIMVSDSWHQYYPFLRELQRLLKEGALPLYSWNVGGGSDFLGVVGNYLASPLYLLTAFLPQGQIWLKMYLAFTVVLRIGCAGGFMAIFLRKTFKRNDLSIVYFSLMYALCGYIMGYYWNMMWLDSLALMPLVIAGTVSVLKEGKYSLYVISLALSVIFSFYIGYFVCIFVLLFSVCYTIVNFKGIKHSLKNAGKMVLYTLIAFMITAFMTVPVYMALSHSDSAADTAGFPLEYTINVAYGAESNGLKDTFMEIAGTATNLLSFTAPITMEKGEPNIFCGALSLVLGVFYFTCSKIKIKEKIVSLALLGFMILSFVVNQLNYIWHGFNTPAMVYHRFSFIFSFILITLAYRAFCLVDSFGKKSFIAAAGILAVYLSGAFFLQSKLSVAITAAAAVVIITGLVLYRKGKLKYRVFSLLLCLFVMCEMGLSAFYGVKVVGYSKGGDYPTQEKAVAGLSEIAENLSGDDKLYRTEFVSPFTTNDGALYSLYGVSTFNSMCRVDYTDMFTEMGLAANKTNNRYVYYESTPVTNLFLNVKYLIDKGDRDLMNDTFMELAATADESLLYENTAYVPMGFMTDKKLMEYELHEGSFLPVDAQNQLFSFSTGIDKNVMNVIAPLNKPESETTEFKAQEGLDYFYVYERDTATDDEVVTMNYEVEESGSYYGMFKSSDVKKITVNIGTKEIESTDRYAYFMSLGYLEKGDKVSVTLPLSDKTKGSITSYLVRFDDEIFKDGADKLRENTMSVTELHNRGFKGNIDVKKDGLFYTSVLFDEGWRVKVDGEEVNVTPVAKTFTAFELTKGEHEIEFYFVPEGLYVGLGITAAGVISFALLGFFMTKRRKSAALNTDCNPENISENLTENTDE